MDSTLGDKDFFNLDLFPQWKKDIWQAISKDARARHAFPKADYFDNGLLKPYLDSYQPIFSWLQRKTNKDSMSMMEPLWEYTGDCKWVLEMVDTDDWVHVHGNGPDKAYTRQTTKRRPAQRGGIYIDGLPPSNDVGEDWDFIDSDSIPEVDFQWPKRNRCVIM